MCGRYKSFIVEKESYYITLIRYMEATIKQDFEYIATKLGITVDELQEYMDAPNKTYKDYKNQMAIYDVGAKVLRMLGVEKGGKR